MPEQISPISVADEMSKSFLEYSMSVIISRALPDARDGLKPSQRRILYSMQNDLSLRPGAKHKKCARIVGDTMGKYHPHGDGAIYTTLTNMAQPWSMREIFVDGQGNFGSVEGDAPAAMRYTEARLTHLGSAMMTDMDKSTVDFTTTYDEQSVEPAVLPAAIPNLLVNGGTGIAVGMATNIPPHNLGEVIDAVCAKIDDPNITDEELQQHIKGPDFPAHCEIRGYKGIDKYFKTGRGSVKMRGTMEIEENDNGRSKITITEVPYGVNRATLQERIAELSRDKILEGISEIRDLSDENTRIELYVKREARPQVVMNQIYKLTSMETSFGVNMLAIHDRRPKQLSVPQALDCYIEHRREVVIRRTQHLLDKSEERAEKLEAFLLALGHLDDFISIIRDSKNRDEARARLRAYEFSTKTAEELGILIRSQTSIQGDKYVFSSKQVDDILELRLYQLTGMEQDKVKGDYDGVIVEIKDFMDILAKESRVLAIIKDELAEIKEKHATPRMTKILPDEGEISIEDLIANDQMIVTITHGGNIKRTIADEFRVQARGGKGVKGAKTKKANEEEDFVEHLFSASAHDYLMFFTNTGRVYVERVYELPEAARAAKGRSIRNVINLDTDEKVAAVLPLERKLSENKEDITFGENAGHVFFATKTGKVKKTSLYDFRNFRKDGIIAIKLDEIEEGVINELIDVRLTTGENEVGLVTRQGKSIRFNEAQVKSQGRNTAGMKGITPVDGDYVVGLFVVNESGKLLAVSENGIGKRTDFNEYRAQTRGGKGIITMKTNEKTGLLVSAITVEEADELMLITSSGQSIRIRVCDIRETGRNASGVKLLALNGKEKLQDVARVINDEDDQTEGETTEEVQDEMI